MKTFKTASRALLSDLKAGRDPAKAFEDALKDLSRYDRDCLMLCRSEVDGSISPFHRNAVKRTAGVCRHVACRERGGCCLALPFPAPERSAFDARKLLH